MIMIIPFKAHFKSTSLVTPFRIAQLNVIFSSFCPSLDKKHLTYNALLQNSVSLILAWIGLDTY